MRRKGEDEWPDEFYTELSVGEILRRARLEKRQDTETVGRLLHIRSTHLDALERSDFDSLPGRAYVLGFVRTYAEYLDLDGARVVGLLKHQSSGELRPGAMNVFTPMADTRQPNPPILWAALSALLLIGVMWAAYQGPQLNGDKDIPPVPVGLRTLDEIEALSKPAPAPTPAQPAIAQVPIEPEKPTTKPDVIVIEMRADSWVELRGPDGRVVEARLFRVGEDITLDPAVDAQGRAYQVTIGDAAAVRLRVGEGVVPPLGPAGQVVRQLILDPATLQAKNP